MSKVSKIWLAVPLLILCLLDPGCGTTGARTPWTPEQSNPRAKASSQLTDQGRMLLESGRPEDAISILERSLGLDPTNGENYYYLSEAWLMKNNIPQAAEFHRLAELYLKGNPDWTARLVEQHEQIDNLRTLRNE